MSEPSPTHVNAYKTDLAEAEKELTLAQGRVESLRAKVKEMDPEFEKAEPDEVESTPEVTEEETTETVEDLEKLKRDELEEKAEAAGVESPEDFPNKAELAEATVEAQEDTKTEDTPSAPEA